MSGSASFSRHELTKKFEPTFCVHVILSAAERGVSTEMLARSWCVAASSYHVEGDLQLWRLL